MRLLPGKVFVGGAQPLERAVSVQTNKWGYEVAPAFAFTSSDEGSLRALPSNGLIVIYARARETPYLRIVVNQTDDIVLPQVACPAPT